MQVLWIIKKTKSTFLLINIACQQYWSNEHVCLKLQVSVSSFLNIRTATWTSPVKKKFFKILQNLLKNVRAVVCTLIQFQAKGLQHCWKETPVYVLSQEFQKSFKNTYFVERRRKATSEISSKNQNSSIG